MVVDEEPALGAIPGTLAVVIKVALPHLLADEVFHGISPRQTVGRLVARQRDRFWSGLVSGRVCQARRRGWWWWWTRLDS